MKFEVSPGLVCGKEPLQNSRGNRRESTRTARKKPDRQGHPTLPSSERPRLARSCGRAGDGHGRTLVWRTEVMADAGAEVCWVGRDVIRVLRQMP